MNFVQIILKISIIFIVFFLNACQSENALTNNGVLHYIIDNEGYTEICDASEWMDVQVIDLKTDGFDSYISEAVAAFKATSDKIIVFDRSDIIKITAFDLTGNYLWNISASNEGYEFFSDIGNVEFYEDRFEVYDQYESTFYYYDYNGKYLGDAYAELDFEDKILLYDDLFAFNIYQHNNYHIAPSDKNESFSILFIDSTGFVGKALPYPSYINDRIAYGIYENFSKYKGETYYHRVFTDTVYQFEEKNAIPSYILSFKNKHLGADFFLEYKGESLLDYALDNRHPFVKHTLQSDKYVMSKYDHPTKGLVFSCVEKKEKNSLKDIELCNSNLLRIGDKLLPIPLAYNDGKFITLLNKYQYELLQKIAAYEKFPNQEEIASIVESMGEETDEENPVLILYTIKE